MISPALTCGSCGAALAPGRLRGLCARCLMRGITEESTSPGEGPERIRISGHEVGAELARGGMGIVYAARQLAPERQVALKMLLPQMISEELRERFRLEARAMADLSHPGILPLYQFGEWADVPWFTMKLAGGGTLAARRESYRGEWRKAAALLAGLADAVAHAHEHGVLHRDLKPGNVLFDDTGRAYVADFGLVKVVGADSQLTRSVAMLGTPQYLAPEVAARDARAATVRSDVYSLGAVLYELLAQRPPFLAESLPALLREIAENEPAALRKWSVPRDLAVIAHTCLAKSPERRYDSAAALAADLRAWLAGDPIKARPVSPGERLARYVRRHPALSLLSLALLAAVISAAVLQERARRSLQVTTGEALTAQVHAIRQGRQWSLRDAGLAAAAEAARLGNTLALRNDAITLLATPSCRELDRRPFPAGAERLAISPDGTRYAVVENAGLVLRSFDSTVPDEVIPPPDSAAVFRQTLAVSPDGSALLVQTADDFCHLRDLTGKAWAPVRYPIEQNPVFSPDGQWIAHGQDDAHAVILEDWRHPEKQKTLASGFATALPAAFSPDGRLLAVASQGQGAVEILDIASGTRLHRLEQPQWASDRPPAVTWRPDSRALAVNSWVLDVFVWYLDAGEPFRRRFSGHTAEVQNVAWHPHGEWLASTGFDGTLRIWEASSGRAGLIDTCLVEFGLDLQFAAAGSRLFFLDSFRQELVRYQFTAPSVVQHTALPRRAPDEGMQRGPWGLDLSPDGRLAVVGGSLGTWVLDTASGRLLASLPTGLVNDVKFSAGGSAFWLCSAWTGVMQCRLTDLGGGGCSLVAPRMVWPTDAGLARLSESRLTGLTALSTTNTLLLFPAMERNQTPATLDTGGIPINPVAISPDGHWLAAASVEQHDENAFLWDLTLTEKSPPRRLPDTRACYMVWSPDSLTLYTVSREGLTAWEAGSWRPRWRRPSPAQMLTHAYPAVSGDGSLLAISRRDHGVDLFVPASGAQLATIDHPDARSIGWLALDHTGSRLAINGSGGNIQLWDLRKLRAELTALGLDWPATPIAPPSPEAATPVKNLTVLPPLKWIGVDAFLKQHLKR